MSDSSQSLIRACEVVKNYRLGRRQVEVLRGVDFQVQLGEFVGLQGASGAGKSTLLHLLGGLDQPTSGKVEFSDNDLAQIRSGKLAQFRSRKVGFVFQNFQLLPELDAMENVWLPARLARFAAAPSGERALHLLERVGLSNRVDHRPTELSGGEQQRVAIARALMNKPDLLLADEPTGNLDRMTGDGIIDLLCELREESRMTLIIATHDARVAARAPRVLELVDGKIASDSAVVPPDSG